MPSPKTERPCEGCGDIFPLAPKQRWHSKECHGLYAIAKPKLKLVCQNPACRIEFEKTAHQIGAGTGEFHDVKCANEARKVDEAVRFRGYANGAGVEPAHVPGIGPCIEWTGPLTKDGYGAFNLADGAHGKQLQAHIYAWALASGPVPQGQYVLHKCDNRLCVRVAHLFLGTKPDNTQDMVNKDRQAKGVRMATAKLNDERVHQVRLDYATGEYSQQVLAAREGVSQHTISCVIRGQTWNHVR